MIRRSRVGLILGARVLPDGSPSPALKRRALHAAGLYRSGHVDRLIASGAGTGAPLSEARAAHDLCRAEGVPEDRIRLEETARSTYENIKASLPLIAPGEEVVLITDRYHAPRARLVARRLGLDATSAAPSLRGAPLVPLARNCAREALAWIWYALHPPR